jgi:hypothetical protein
MTHDEPEITAVRATLTRLAGSAAQPTDAAVARTWSRVTTPAAPAGRPVQRGPIQRWRGLSVAATAAAVVVAIAVVAVLLRPTPRATVQAGAPPAPTTPTGKATAPTPTTGAPIPTANVPDHGAILGPVSLSQAVAAMVAASATAVPPTIPQGQMLYHRTDWYELDPSPETPPGGRVDLDWWDPTTSTIARMVRFGKDFGSAAVSPPPGATTATAAGLAQVPTDPSQLYNLLVVRNANTKNGGTHYVTKEVFELFRFYGPLIPPTLRAALFRVLGMANGETVNQITVDGRTYDGFRDISASPDVAGYLLCDPATGQAVGERYQDGGIELWHYAVVASTDEIP